MPVKKYKPVTPGQRTKLMPTFEEVTSSTPEKSLIRPMKRSGGRNNQGRMTTRYMGGGHKKRYRLIDFKRDKDGMTAKVKSIEYDPNRSAYIALVVYDDGEKRYILAPEKLKVGDIIQSGEDIAPEIGNTLPLSKIPLGTGVHNIELKPGQGGKIVRTCRATVGQVSNKDHGLVLSGKAGRKRWLGRRPRVRGVAMNPVDHPMGGGEGRASGGHPRSRTGLIAKGYKTRSKKKPSNKYIVERRKTKK